MPIAIALEKLYICTANDSQANKVSAKRPDLHEPKMMLQIKIIFPKTHLVIFESAIKLKEN